MNRRGFLGFFGGAAIAGPAAAREAVSSSHYEFGRIAALVNNFEPCTVESADAEGVLTTAIDYVPGELREVLPVVPIDGGHRTRWALRLAEARIAALRSVSPIQKLRMLRNALTGDNDAS